MDVNILLCFHQQIKDFMMFKMENYCLVGSSLERNVTVSEECCPVWRIDVGCLAIESAAAAALLVKVKLRDPAGPR